MAGEDELPSSKRATPAQTAARTAPDKPSPESESLSEAAS